MQATKLRSHEIRHRMAHTNATCVGIFSDKFFMDVDMESLSYTLDYNSVSLFCNIF